MDTELTQAKDNESLETANEPEASSPEVPKKRFPILPLILGVPLLCLLAVYVAGAFYYQNHFLNHTIINDIDVSKMTILDLKAQIEDYSLPVVQRQADGTTLEEGILGSSIGLSCSSTEPFQEILENQNHWLWFLSQEEDHTLENPISYDEASLKDEIQKLKGFDKDFVTSPEDAYITDYEPGHGFQIVPEVVGNKLSLKKTQETIATAIKELKKEVNLDEAGCYEEPRITAENEELKAAFAKLQSYAETAITYTFGSEKEVLDGDTICTWLQVDGYEITLDQAQVEEYVASLRKKHDTVFRPRTFQTSYGTEITIKNGDYGWWMDTDQEVAELTEMIEQGQSGERTPVYRQTAASYDTPDYGNTYVEINLTAQHLYFYKDGALVVDSDFVSGNVARGHTTPPGAFPLTYKQRNAVLKGEGYASPVSYWMPFNGGIGMHDASWRGSFGGKIYRTNGSHGCVNLPASAARTIFEGISAGMPVLCYNLEGTSGAAPVALAVGSPAPGLSSSDAGSQETGGTSLAGTGQNPGGTSPASGGKPAQKPAPQPAVPAVAPPAQPAPSEAPAQPVPPEAPAQPQSQPVPETVPAPAQTRPQESSASVITAETGDWQKGPGIQSSPAAPQPSPVPETVPDPSQVPSPQPVPGSPGSPGGPGGDTSSGGNGAVSAPGM